MPPQILAAKLRIPRAHRNLAPRPRLTERLLNGLGGKLTLVCGPPGYGKTTLLRELAVRAQHHVLWLSLDQGDNVPEVLVGYLISALQTTDAALATSIRSNLPTAAASAMESALIVLLNELDSLTSQIILILDNYQVIENATIHQGIAFLLEHQPPQLHLVISSRTFPPLPLARLRVRGEINELHTEDLRFRLDESLDFFRRSNPGNISSTSVAAFHRSAEGWIDGLQRALQSIDTDDGEQESDGLALSLDSDPSIMDYFGEEILSREPSHIQEFLLQTSILNHLNVSLCEAVTADRQAHVYLKQTIQHNLFLLASTMKPEWFRYHRLFVALLRQRLQESHLDLIPVLHQRASIWYEDNGYPGEAIRHALSGQDWDRARRLMATNAETMALQSQLVTANRWIREFSTRQGPSPSGRRGEPDTDLGKALPDLSSDASRQTDMNTILSLANIHLSLGEVGNAEELLSGVDLARAADWDEQTNVILVGALGETLLEQGKLHLAAATYRPLLSAAISALPQPSAFAFCWGIARIYYEWNQLDDAATILKQCATFNEQANASPEALQCTLLLAKIFLITGQQRAFTTTMDHATRLAELSASRAHLNQIHAHEARAGLLQGDPGPVARWLERSGIEPTDTVPYGRQFEYLTLTWALVALKQADRALPLLDHLHQTAEMAGRGTDLIEIGALKALAFQAAGEPRRAFAEVANALCLAESGRYVRTFVDKGAPMATLLELAHARGVTLLHVRELLTTLPSRVFAAEDLQKVPIRATPSEQLVEPLTARELEVLRLISSGCSNREVADALTLAISTVKKHMSNILGKLAAKNRTEAVAKAQALHLL